MEIEIIYLIQMLHCRIMSIGLHLILNRDVSLHSHPEWVVYAQLPLAHLALGHELENAHNKGTKVGIHFEHCTLAGPGRPRRSWLCCEIDV
jgi:hypothetical protein